MFQVYVWNIPEGNLSASGYAPSQRFEGHTDEVSSVDCCITEYGKLASCADDSTVRIWSINRGLNQKQEDRTESSVLENTRSLVIQHHVPQLESKTAVSSPASATSASPPTKPTAATCLQSSGQRVALPSNRTPGEISARRDFEGELHAKWACSLGCGKEYNKRRYSNARLFSHFLTVFTCSVQPARYSKPSGKLRTPVRNFRCCFCLIASAYKWLQLCVLQNLY